MRRFVSYGPAMVVMAMVLAVLVAVPAMVRRASYAQTSAQILLARQTIQEDDILLRINQAVQAIATSVRPSVVHIEISAGNGFRVGTGAGWVYDNQGHLITNAHVVRGAKRINIQFADGRISKASVVGIDNFTDIAVLKVSDIQGLFPASRATGLTPRQGERVFAFGSPFGFKFSMSEGIISGLGRDPATAIGNAGFTNFIQTDAAVNPGNSGGPIVNVQSQVIAMSVAIATGRDNQGSNEGQSAGIGFAIPLATIESVVKQIISKGRVSRGFLGITYSSRAASIEDDSGFLGVGLEVNTVTDNGPADKAGLKPGDVISSIAGQPLQSVEVLRSVVGPASPGENIPLRIWRDGQFMDMQVTLGEFPRPLLIEQSLMRFGVQIGETSEGNVLINTFRWSSAWKAGFRPGQRIVRIDDHPVNTAQNAFTLLAQADLLEGQSVPVSIINSEGEALVFKLKLTE